MPKIKYEYNWEAELKNSIQNIDELLNILNIEEQHRPVNTAKQAFTLRVPQSYIARMEKGNINDPLLQQVLPQDIELLQVPSFTPDPLQEKKYNILPGLLHKYYGRVLVMLSGSCAIHCRYCFRRNFPYEENTPGNKGLEKIIAYIEQHPEITEVILSGGDPLIAKDAYLNKIIETFSQIKSLITLRIHTRIPIVLPSRINDTLLQILHSSALKKVIVLHTNHPNELNTEVIHNLQRLQQANITLLNQSVFLKGINDCSQVLAALSHKLFQAGVLPYYIHRLDKVSGAAHFAISEYKAKSIMRHLLAHLPGYLVPKFVQESPGALSKTPITYV